MTDLERLETFVTQAGRAPVLMLGAADSGKSYLLDKLAESLTKGGRRVAVIDADPGQSRIGPPTTMGLQHKYEPGVGADALYFVGSVSPPGHLLPMLSGLVILTRRAEQAAAELVLIDTPGFLAGSAARVLWDSVIDVLQPAVVLIERQGEPVGPWLAGVSPLLRLPASPAVVSRSRQARQLYRAEAFGRYFSGGGELCLDAGVPVRWVDGSSLPGGRLRPGQLVSLRGADAVDLALGLVIEHDDRQGCIRLRCGKLNAESVRTVVASRLQIAQDNWRESPLA